MKVGLDASFSVCCSDSDVPLDYELCMFEVHTLRSMGENSLLGNANFEMAFGRCC